MQDSMDKCGHCPDRPITAETIIKELISHADMAFFEEGLHNLFVSFVNNEELCKGAYKDDVIYTYTALRTLIKDVDKLKSLKS